MQCNIECTCPISNNDHNLLAQHVWLILFLFFFRNCLHVTLDCIFPYLIQKEEITSWEERVKKLLELTPPKGTEFLHKIEHILEREKNWVSIFLKLFLPMFSCFLAHKHVVAIYY